MSMHQDSSADNKNKAFIMIKQVKSACGRLKSQIATIKGLNLKMGHVACVEDTPSTRGMIKKVQHLIEIIKE